MSSLNCDRPLHSEIRAPETVMSTGDGQITDSVRAHRPTVHRASHCSTRTCYDLAGKAGRLWAAQGCQGISSALKETGRQAAWCKHTTLGSPNRLTYHIIHTNTYLAYMQWADLTWPQQ